MMAPNSAQLDLLEWEPPAVVRAFAPELVRGATLEARISRAVSVALQECGLTRQQVAERMTAFLGERVSVPMVNAYASPARAEHAISLTRFIALVHATGDRRLLEFLAEPAGLAVVERQHVPLIEVAMIGERRAELKRREEALWRQARKGR